MWSTNTVLKLSKYTDLVKLSEQLRDTLLLQVGDELRRGEPAAVALSGGLDSFSVLWAIREHGVRAHAYTFHIDNWPSDDLVPAKQIARIMGCQHTTITIPNNLVILAEDVVQLVKRWGPRKTKVQAGWHYYHLFRHVTERQLACGWGADDLHGHTRQASIIGRRDNAAFRRIREQTLMDWQGQTASAIMDLANEQGISVIMPYRSKALIAFFEPLGFWECCGFYPKQLGVLAFDFIARRYGIRFKSANLQIGSSGRRFHDLLLQSELNQYNRTQVAQIYRDIWKR